MIYGGGNQGAARLLEFPSGKKICEIPDVFPHMFVADFSSDGKQVVLIGTDLQTRRFETATGKELTKYEPAHSNSVRAVAISNGGNYVVSSGPSNETYLWDAESGKLLHKLDVKQQPNVINEVYSLAFSPDDKLLAGGGAQNLLLWNTETGAVEKIYPTSSGGAVHIRFDKESKELTTVHGFHGTRGDDGEDLLVYPRVQKWPVGTQ
jgi:WD40 repeat protein